MLRRIGGYLVLGWLALPAGAMAADLHRPPAPLPTGGQCLAATGTPLLSLPPTDLARAVGQRYAHAVETAERVDVIYSARPAHTWALEARTSCGKAIGYLKTRTVDAVAISKCACFYERMLRFMP